MGSSTSTCRVSPGSDELTRLKLPGRQRARAQPHATSQSSSVSSSNHSSFNSNTSGDDGSSAPPSTADVETCSSSGRASTAAAVAACPVGAGGLGGHGGRGIRIRPMPPLRQGSLLLPPLPGSCYTRATVGRSRARSVSLRVSQG